MKRLWKRFVDLSRTSADRGPRRRQHRQIVAPEHLESRNAPGVMLPMLPLMDPFTDDPDHWEASLSSDAEQVEQIRSAGRRDSTAPNFAGSFSLDPVIDLAQGAPTVGEETVYENPSSTINSRVTSSPAIPYEIAALDAAFELLGTEQLINEPIDSSLPSALSLPVETPAPQETQSLTSVAVTGSPARASAASAISTPTSTGAATDGGGSQTPPAKMATSSAPPIFIAASAAAAAVVTPEMPVDLPPQAENAVSQTVSAPVVHQSETSSEIVADSSTIGALAAVAPLTTHDQLSTAEVDELLDRATLVTDRNDAIIAIVDRSGRILGVHVEQGVLNNIPDADTRVFAIDGAIAKARTAAFFSNDQAALTSRTVRFISQSTITEREVDSNPNSADQGVRGPGFVGPVGLGGHFPPDVAFTPHADLFAIEHTNRDSLVHPGPDRVKQTATVDNDGNPTAASGDDILLGTRFGANFVTGQEIPAPESYGLVSDMLTNAQARGIGTLPGGVPLYKTDPGDGKQKLVGGVGVFFPGTDGFASFEQAFVAGVGQATVDRINAPLVLESEYTAAVIASNLSAVAGLAPVAGIGFPPLPGGGRIDLAGITLESFGPHPFKASSFLAWGQSTFNTGTDSGTRMTVTKGGALAVVGESVPEGWLVNPTASAELTADEVRDIIDRGIAEAEQVRSAIRLPVGQRSRMVLAVTDLEGEVLGLFRMSDATFFSIDVAVAKARNVAYYADASEIKDIDRIDADGDGNPDVAAGVALTNRTFRFISEARFPDGIEQTPPGPFSTLLTPGVDPATGENLPGMTPDASDFTTVLGFDAFNPGSNFREDVPTTGFQNGVVFFPGSTPLYRNGQLVGGLGISGDGVDQDDVVTFSAAGEFLPRLNANDSVTRADEVFVRGVRLPYQNFLRNPRG
ncbi:MAG: heme-binding protein [Thermoguttaceae bacterium]